MKLNEMAWPNIKDYLKREKRLLIPLGTCEQHGRHLPLNTDTVVAETVADRVSEQTGILVAPVLEYGVNLPCDCFFWGTNSATESSMMLFIKDMLEWWTKQGFDQFIFLTAHGDPFHVKAAAQAGEHVQVIELYDLDLSDILEKQPWVRHACEGETSVMLYLRPELVHMDCAVDFSPDINFSEYLNHINTNPILDSPGNLGFPSAASAEKGKRIFERMIENAVSQIIDLSRIK